LSFASLHIQQFCDYQLSAAAIYHEHLWQFLAGFCDIHKIYRGTTLFAFDILRILATLSKNKTLHMVLVFLPVLLFTIHR
jgi:hypothetical protein